MLKSFVQFIAESSKEPNSFEEALDRGIPDWVIDWVWQDRSIGKVGSLEDYRGWVEHAYADYFVTHHYSRSDEILRASISTPTKRGQENFNSADAFFVSPKLEISEDKLNFFILVPKGLNFLLTDYNFSNAPEIKEGFKFDPTLETDFRLQWFSWIGDRSRELGYDAIVPDDGRYEIIIVNPESLIPMGSLRDLDGFLGYLERDETGLRSDNSVSKLV
jgi:hypothetical protein